MCARRQLGEQLDLQRDMARRSIFELSSRAVAVFLNRGKRGEIFMNKRKFSIVALVITLVCVSSAVVFGADVIKIGLITPETGEVSSYGLSVRDAVKLGIENLNASGGLLGKEVQLITYDDKGNAVDAVNAAQRLIEKDNVSIIIGPVITPCVLSVAPIAQEKKIAMITPTGTGDTITDMGDYIFRACYKDSFQGRVMAKFAIDELKFNKAAVIFDVANDYSVGVQKAFVEEFKALGGEIVTIQSYASGDPDFNAQLTKIKNAKPDVLFIPDYYSSAGPITFQARQQGLSIPFLGVDGWDSPEMFELAGGAEEGAYIVNHYSSDDDSLATQDFIRSYKEKYGKAPDAFAALGYDAVYLVVDAIRRAGSTDRIAIKEALAVAKDVVAATGTISLDETGSPIKDAVILQYVGGKQALVTKIRP